MTVSSKEFKMLDNFFKTNKTNNNEIDLKENNKSYSIVFNYINHNIEYFKLDNLINNCKFKNIKSCDYVIINHTLKKILLCEIKERKKGYLQEAKEQLVHSKLIIECFFKNFKFTGLQVC